MLGKKEKVCTAHSHYKIKLIQNHSHPQTTLLPFVLYLNLQMKFNSFVQPLASAIYANLIKITKNLFIQKKKKKKKLREACLNLHPMFLVTTSHLWVCACDFSMECADAPSSSICTDWSWLSATLVIEFFLQNVQSTVEILSYVLQDLIKVPSQCHETEQLVFISVA